MPKNDVCYVIGGGPSLAGFDFARLPEGYRIGANKSAWLANCDALVTVDRNFHNNCAAQITAFPGEKIVAYASRLDPLPGVAYWRREAPDGLSHTRGSLCGTNSGYAALNLAIIGGFREIALLGFDFSWHGGASHYHEGYAWQNRHTHSMLQVWVKAFDKVADYARCTGISITNFTGTPPSKLRCFPTRPLEDLY
jgi:hypothetical protein